MKLKLPSRKMTGISFLLLVIGTTLGYTIHILQTKKTSALSSYDLNASIRENTTLSLISPLLLCSETQS